MKTYKDKNGNKLYPVCSWEKNQHKLYNALDKANIRMYDIRDGLIDGDIFEMDEMSGSNITHKGGTMLYTARSVEFRTEEGMQIAKANCEKLGLEGIVVLGGDGSFRGAADLSARGILTVGIPCTIDNDIACTEYTIGYDTAMNTAMEMVDKLQDTSQSHDRCAVVEVMGRGAGFIAVNTAVACGAIEVITKEMPYDLNQGLSSQLRRNSSAGTWSFMNCLKSSKSSRLRSSNLIMSIL